MVRQILQKPIAISYVVESQLQDKDFERIVAFHGSDNQKVCLIKMTGSGMGIYSKKDDCYYCVYELYAWMDIKNLTICNYLFNSSWFRKPQEALKAMLKKTENVFVLDSLEELHKVTMEDINEMLKCL